jgi:hypothetical protein
VDVEVLVAIELIRKIVYVLLNLVVLENNILKYHTDMRILYTYEKYWRNNVFTSVQYIQF